MTDTQLAATRVVAALTRCSEADRRAMRDDDPAREVHGRYVAAVSALHEVEVGGSALRSGATGELRLAVWNVERLTYLDDVAATLTALAPDVCLLSEIDKGMARSANGHRTAELAARLGQAYAYGVEFVELDLGKGAERGRLTADFNAEGFHGNAITSAVALSDPFIARFDPGGDWYVDRSREEPRVGGRMAIGARIELDGRPVVVVALHLESHSSPELRARQMERLVEMVEPIADGAPIVIAGDVNTSVLDRDEIHADRAGWLARVTADPSIILHPERTEPMFGVMARRGFEWRQANVLGAPTVRPDPADPLRPIGKIDWIFTRGLVAEEPRIIPALRADGGISSDHDCLFVRLRLA